MRVKEIPNPRKYCMPVMFALFCLYLTFCSNSKCSFLKVVCNFTRLYEGNPLQPLRLNFFGIDYPLHLHSQFPFFSFHRQAGQQNKGKGMQSPHARSDTQPAHPRDITTHSISQLSTTKVIPTPLRAISCRRAPLEEYFPCVS